MLKVVIHKLLLFTALFCSDVFDTSTKLLFKNKTSLADKLAQRLMVWDNVHFNSVMLNGIRFEHEYAFSYLWAKIVDFVSPYKTQTSLMLTAALISLLCHVVSAFLVKKICGGKWKFAEVYFLNPAGIFLVAGYTESVFAMLVLAGVLLVRKRQFVFAGVVIGLATLLRSNGLIFGILFLFELHRRQLSVVVGGMLVFLAFFSTQFMAFNEHCPGLEWCDKLVPSVYLYVQKRYWNNGFLKYWTLPNIPNFIEGAPTLVLLLLSSRMLYRKGEYGMVAVQMVMFLGALFFWHVQIITRLASCLYGPTYYVATRGGKWWIWYFILWTVVQAALFGAFLPPA